MKALQDRCVANEGVTRQFRKQLEIENKKRDQYNEVVRTLNTELTTKLALLEKETRHCEEVEKAKTNLMTELGALCEQMEKAKANAVAGFRVSQSYYDKCTGYYVDGFNDC